MRLLRTLALLPVAIGLVVALPGTASAAPNCVTVGTTVVACDEEDLGTLWQPHPWTYQLDGARVEICWYLTSPGGLCFDQTVDIGETGVIRPTATPNTSGTTTVPPICYRGNCTPTVDVPLSVDIDGRRCPNGDYLVAYLVVHGIEACVGVPPQE
jgi:hypothetical protein